MNAAEKKAVRKLHAYAAALGWVPVFFDHGEDRQYGADRQPMTADELIASVESVDDGLIIWRNYSRKGDKGILTARATIRTILRLYYPAREVIGTRRMKYRSAVMFNTNKNCPILSAGIGAAFGCYSVGTFKKIQIGCFIHVFTKKVACCCMQP
jgi:hypothetical protein